jgi:hypothetical protein
VEIIYQVFLVIINIDGPSNRAITVCDWSQAPYLSAKSPKGQEVKYAGRPCNHCK